ncbi:MAG: hypothetical protein QW328_07535 [Nitrososphaerota archaeon]
MARKSLSVKISEALELSERLNKLLNTLSPEIRQIILKHMRRRSMRGRRKASTIFRRVRPKRAGRRSVRKKVGRKVTGSAAEA